MKQAIAFVLFAAFAVSSVTLAETLAETRALCQTAHDRRFPKDSGPDDAGAFYEWDRLQAISNDALVQCQEYVSAREDFLGNASTVHTIPDLKAFLSDCNAAVALLVTARSVLAADKAACAAASTVLACANDMGFPGECVGDGGTPDGGP